MAKPTKTAGALTTMGAERGRRASAPRSKYGLPTASIDYRLDGSW